MKIEKVISTIEKPKKSVYKHSGGFVCCFDLYFIQTRGLSGGFLLYLRKNNIILVPKNNYYLYYFYLHNVIAS